MRSFEGPCVVFRNASDGSERRFRLCLMKVLTCDKHDVPENLRLIADNETVHIKNGDRFITAYVSDDNLPTVDGP